MHAVTYGLIFDALGRSLQQTLKEYGELRPARAAREFEDSIGEHIETGVQQVVGMAVAEKKRREPD
ncbi:MAG: hypothetical protein U5K76_12795 [Woeseiaceae bacterium]|nr:hypothetical protein [Woeseiaceae bacterium]